VPITYRPPHPAELADCALIWYTAVDEYMARLNKPLPSPYLDPLLTLLQHLLSTDPERFLVAVRSRTGETGRPPEQIVGFGVAVQREHVWFLSQLYVLPEEQGKGIGRDLLTQIFPGVGRGETAGGKALQAGSDKPGEPSRLPDVAERPGIMATCTDSAQPVSNGLYSRFGIVPRVPIFNLVGNPRLAALPPLPPDVQAVAMDHLGPRAARVVAASSSTRPEWPAPGSSSPVAIAARDLAAIVDDIDREVLGYAHPMDHALLRATGRSGFVYLSASGEPLGYGYSSEVGRFGPVAMTDETLTAPVIGHLCRTIRPRGATSAWIPGSNDRAIVALLRAGMRIEGFPAQLCWTRPFGAFDRYMLASLALL
jgi:GNAT superfamily N-acetyltransferase